MTAFPETLRSWRKAKRFSQLELAVEADVSSRHISFLETGRARPSREMIGRLGDALHLPLSARNQMLTHAGFAARYPGRAWDDEEMAPIRAAMDHMLANHAPYPALAIDRLWTIVRMNGPAAQLFGQFGAGEGDSLLDLLTSAELPNVVENWQEVAHHVAQRLRTESAAQGGVEALDQAANQLGRLPQSERATPLPIVPTILHTGDQRLSMFSTIAQFGTPEDLTLDDLRIELYFPTDAATRVVFEALGG
jgi:transcriptional regulator with XRE-family HTH domain